MRAFDRWCALETAEQWLTVKSAVMVAAAAVSLRLLGVERSLKLAMPDTHGVPKSVIADVVAAVDRAGRYVPGGTCLTRSLALAWMLRRRGVAASVRIGTRKNDGRFEAHAWVECAGLEFAVHGSPFTVLELQTANRKL